MIRLIATQPGRIFHAVGQPDLLKTRPIYAFVPEGFLLEKGLDLTRYLASQWPSSNCSANPLAIGSHVIPDPGKPVAVNSRCPILREFLANLETVATIKTSSSA